MGLEERVGEREREKKLKKKKGKEDRTMRSRAAIASV